jgi:hypothetical protein
MQGKHGEEKMCTQPSKRPKVEELEFSITSIKRITNVSRNHHYQGHFHSPKLLHHL